VSKKPDAINLGSCPIPLSTHDSIQLSHGSGGKLTNDLINELFLKCFDNPALSKRDDQAVLEIGGQKLAFTTDSYVVDPIFFPGGDIGELAVNGTVNDLCMCGARPLYLSCGFIVEEGLSMTDLARVVDSMKKAAAASGVQIVTGDTKVVNKGKGDKLFINTAGIGIIEHNYTYSADQIRPGDIVLINGPIAAHGMAILSQREGLAFESPIESDTAALNGLIDNLVQAAGDKIHAMRDPTRGGVAAVLNEFAEVSRVGVLLSEDRIQVDPPVAGACELLGIDPLYVANEGKVVVIAEPSAAETLLDTMRRHPLGAKATVLGEVHGAQPGLVSLRTRLGAERILDMPVGEQLPRIC
jgi:hydrogenase expression/formation protein HypE